MISKLRICDRKYVRRAQFGAEAVEGIGSVDTEKALRPSEKDDTPFTSYLDQRLLEQVVFECVFVALVLHDKHNTAPSSAHMNRVLVQTAVANCLHADPVLSLRAHAQLWSKSQAYVAQAFQGETSTAPWRRVSKV